MLTPVKITILAAGGVPPLARDEGPGRTWGSAKITRV